jgi:gamma-glutamyltranspeptidase/glutathione hydrolase
MTPTIVEKDKKLFMVVGTPGGSTIITSVMQAILNVYEYKMSMQEAVNNPVFTIGCQMKYLNPIHLIKNY